ENVETVCQKEAEFGVPQWVFGLSVYAFDSPERIVCAYIECGMSKLGAIDTRSKVLTPIETPFTDISFVRVSKGKAVFRAGSPTDSAAIVTLDLGSGAREVLRRSNNVSIDREFISVPQAIEFPTSNGLTAHAFFYEPRNGNYSAPSGDRPPLL